MAIIVKPTRMDTVITTTPLVAPDGAEEGGEVGGIGSLGFSDGASLGNDDGMADWEGKGEGA